MNQRIFEELARQRQADMQRRSLGRECGSPAAPVPAGAVHATGLARRPRAGRPFVSASTQHGWEASQSIRARTGWWLVDLGLKLAVRPDSRTAASPRPAGS